MDSELFATLEQHRSEMKQWFDHIHQNPETAFEEVDTSNYIASLLESWGYDVVRGVAKTGIIATLITDPDGPSIGLRSELDALPIQENGTCDVQSKVPGKSHMCGHDGHMTMLLGAAQYLASTRNFKGTLHLIFEPAEETSGGAQTMLDEGVLERFPMDYMFGMHNTPGLKPGKIYLHSGGSLSAADIMTIKLTGKGGHGSMPHDAKDPVVAGAAIVMALQTIVSRNVDPRKIAVVTVGSFQSGVAANIIPQTAKLLVNTRTFDPEVRELVLRRIREIAEEQAKSYGVSCEIEEDASGHILYNDPELHDKVVEVVTERLGSENVDPVGQVDMASDDFAVFTDKLPCSFVSIGNGDTLGNHNPGYTFCQEDFVPGAAYWAAVAEGFLK